MLALAQPVPTHPPHSNSDVRASSRPKHSARKSTSSVSTSVAGSSSHASRSTSSLASTGSNPGSRPPSVTAFSHQSTTPSSKRDASSKSLAESSSDAEPNLQPHLQPALSFASSMAPVTSCTAAGSSLGPSFDIHTYPTTDLLRHLAIVLNQIATSNDKLSSPSMLESAAEASALPRPTSIQHPPIWNSLMSASRIALSAPSSALTFHARNIPNISLESYLLRILRYCPTTNEVFLSLLIYFDRMLKLAQEATGTRFAVDSYNVHRLVIAGVTVASKFFSDVFYTNSRYAKVGGLPQAELNQLELQFLLLNNFELVISSEEMQRYAESLFKFPESQSVLSKNSEYSDASSPAPARPLQSMGAIDAYGGSVANEHNVPSDGRPNQTPKRVVPVATVNASSAASHGHSHIHSMSTDAQDDNQSATGTETDVETDAETDDEPTIRAHHSGASSETQSCYSVDTSEDHGEDSQYTGVPSVHHPSVSSHDFAGRPIQQRRWTEGDHIAHPSMVSGH